MKGELNGLSCPRCSAWHSMSYAEGGTRIPAGKQVPYPGATASSRRWVQLSQSTVFENSLFGRLSAQMVHSHTGFETFCHELGNAVRRVKGSRPYDSGSRFCVRCRPFAARRTDSTAELEPGNQSTVTVDLSASEGLAAAFNVRLAPDRRTRADRESDACTDALAGVALGGGIGRDVRDHSRCTLARRSVACVQSCVEMRESCLPYVHAMCLPCPSHVSAAPSCA